MTEAVDVVIVGAGAAGAVFAARLAEAGKSVVVLEAGPHWTQGDLVSSQIWSRRLKWGGPRTLAAGEHARGLTMLQGWGVGGAALHHYGAWPRLHPEDFTLKSDHGIGLDWPVSYDELRPFYDRVQAYAGLSGDTAAEVWRPAADPYPQAPSPRFRQGEIVAAAFEKLGFRTSATPAAITTGWHGERPPCQQDGWCDAGCPILSLFNPMALHLPKAEAAGAVIRARSPVTRVLTEKGRAVGVAYVDMETGQRREQRAKLVVLAGAVVQNARLLLASDEGGLGNRSGLVGAYVNGHTFSAGYGLVGEETENHRGHTAGQVFTQDRYGKVREGGAFGSVTWIGASAIKPNDLIGIANTRPDLFGTALHDFMRKGSRHLIQIGSVNEALPVRENRVELAAERDAIGMPLARMVHTLDPRSLALWAQTREEGLRIMKAAGAAEAWGGPPAVIHLMGGTVMGTDPMASVTDSHGRSHDVPNLLIAGTGLFPTAGGVNPTFTLYALAERTLDHVLAHWGDYAHG